MKSIQNQYISLKEGKMSQANFMRNIRMTFPQYITNVTSFNDSIKILKNKGILHESMVPGEAMRIAAEEFARQMGDYTSAVAALEDRMGLSQAEAIAIASELFPDDNDEVNDMVTKGEEEESGKYTKNQDFEGGISEGENSLLNDLYNAEYFGGRSQDGESSISFQILANNPEYFNIYYRIKNSSEGNAKIMKDPNANPYQKKWFRVNLTNFQMDDELRDLIYSPKAYGVFDSGKWIPKNQDNNELNEAVNGNGKQEYSKFGEKTNDNFNELLDGINYEHGCYPEKTYDEIVKIVTKNLKKDSFYYTMLRLTGTPGNKMQTMDSSKPEDHQMKFYTEKNTVDTARGMKKIKIEKKKIKENKEETNPQPSSEKKDDKKVEKPKEFRPGVNLGASFEKFKKQLEEMVREAMNEYYDGRDNIDAENN